MPQPSNTMFKILKLETDTNTSPDPVSLEVVGCLQQMVHLVLSLDLIMRLFTLDTVRVWLIQCSPSRITSLLFSEQFLQLRTELSDLQGVVEVVFLWKHKELSSAAGEVCSV